MNQNQATQRNIAANAARNATNTLINFFYGYSARILALADGGTGTTNVNITADSAFMLQNMQAFVLVGGTYDANPVAFVQLTDTSSGASIFDNSQPISNVFGDAREPFIMPVPRIFPANSVITATILNSTGGVADFYLTFSGRKLYKKGAAGIGY